MKNDAISEVTQKILKILDASSLDNSEKKKAIWRAETAIVKEATVSEGTVPAVEKKSKATKKGKSKKKK